MQTCCTISLCLYVIDIRRFPPAPSLKNDDGI